MCNDLYQVNEIRLLVCLLLLPLMLKFGGSHLVPAEVDVIQLRLLGNQNCNTQKHRLNMTCSSHHKLKETAKSLTETLHQRNTREQLRWEQKKVQTGRKKEETGIVDVAAVLSE